MFPIAWLEIGHFRHMRVPDHTAESGIVGIIDQNHAAAMVVPQHRLILRLTQRASFHIFNSQKDNSQD
jgi:hypothetical protein